MNQSENLQRFLDAQLSEYEIALSEIMNGRKRSHWMWYIFPQIHGLGFSEVSRFYAIINMEEAENYLNHPVLGKRLVQISNVLLGLTTDNANIIFGSPDDLKLKSSMTLFSLLPNADPVFQRVLDKFFSGEKDQKTLQIITDEAKK
ncbi:MAG: DUF1810 domain-containing protein [Bacteroidota bacterium]|nr:DUF1810 domain-containing protein [Bacteroidota bacterium]